MSLALDWQSGLQFVNAPTSPAIVLHSGTPGVTSPPEALAYAVMGCMAMDVIHVLEKGRHDVKAMRVSFEGDRAVDHPRRFVSMSLHFDVTAEVEPSVVARAIELSRMTYCSVWNTIRPDVDLRTSFDIRRIASADITDTDAV
ncbi:MAG: OsmC family protein [Vicinamibacterales bacterium]